MLKNSSRIFSTFTEKRSRETADERFRTAIKFFSNRKTPRPVVSTRGKPLSERDKTNRCRVTGTTYRNGRVSAEIDPFTFPNTDRVIGSTAVDVWYGVGLGRPMARETIVGQKSGEDDPEPGPADRYRVVRFVPGRYTSNATKFQIRRVLFGRSISSRITGPI